MRDLLGRLWGAHALAWIGCFAFLGVRLADWLREFSPAFAAVFCGLLVIGSAIWFWLAKQRSGPALLALTLGVFGATLLCHSAAMRSLPGIERIDQNQSLYVEVSGFIDAVPTTAEGDDSRFFVPFRLEWMREIGREEKISTSARVRLIGRGETPRYGECLQLRGFLKRPKSPRNPGEFDAEEYLRIRRMPAELRAAGDDAAAGGGIPGGAYRRYYPRGQAGTGVCGRGDGE